MPPLTPFDRPLPPRNSCCGKRVCICPVDDHRISRTALSFAALGLTIAVIVIWAGIEIAADWVRAA